MNKSFELNPIEKIKMIQDDEIRNICIVAVEEAQKNIHQSKSIAVDRVFKETSHKLPSIVKGE